MKSLLLIAHLLSVISGIGGALLLDIYLLRHLRGARIIEQDLALVSFIEKFVNLGLFGVWASGIVILASAENGPAAVLQDPKVQAKLVIVVILTLNALVIVGIALPTLRRNLGGHLFDGCSRFDRSLLLSSAIVSTTSWLTPFVLGLARELNHVVPADIILICYAWLVIALALGANIMVPYLYKPHRTATALQNPVDADYHTTTRNMLAAAFTQSDSLIPDDQSHHQTHLRTGT
jgi:hypothetical protein